MTDTEEQPRAHKEGYVRVRTGKFPPIRVASVRIGGLFGKKKDQRDDDDTA